jgi:hypothetical protein
MIIERGSYNGDATIVQSGTEIPVRAHLAGGLDPDDYFDVWAGDFDSPAADMDLGIGDATLVLLEHVTGSIFITKLGPMGGRFRGVGRMPVLPDGMEPALD